MVDIKTILISANPPRPVHTTTYQIETFKTKVKQGLQKFVGEEISVCGEITDVTKENIFARNSLPLGTIASSAGDCWIITGSMLFKINAGQLSVNLLTDLNRYNLLDIKGKIVQILSGGNKEYKDANLIIVIDPTEIKKTTTNWLTSRHVDLEPYVSEEEKKIITERSKKKVSTETNKFGLD